jgi:four helix bundle protein
LLNEEIIILESAGMSLDQHQELKQRTKAFALRIIRMTQALPRNREADVIGRQVLRSATSIAANYRAAGRGRSKAEFTAKLGVVIEETDETVLWLELLAESGIVKPIRLRSLLMKPISCLLCLRLHGGL